MLKPRIRFRLVVILSSICLAVIATPSSVSAQGAPMFALEAKQGPHAVGLKVVEQYDYSRIFQPLIDDLGQPYRGERARPLQTLIWYPAQKSPSGPVTAGDYAALQTTQTSFGKPKQPTGIDEWFQAGMKPASAMQMWAVRDAPLASGHFPVVIYAPSFSSVPWENADLCEYLASYGYVVIASLGMGVTHESTHDLAGIDAQARDISFLIGYAQRLSNTDMSEVGVVGFSWGGISNLFAAARDNRIDALVALDGSMRYFPGLVKQAGDVHPDQMTIPLLFFKGETSLEDQARLDGIFHSEGPNVLNQWTHGDLISVQMLGFVHPLFTSMAHRNEKFWEYEFPGLQVADYGRADGIVGYSWVARYTREFLDAYLKHNASGLKFLKSKPSENGVARHVMEFKFRPARTTPPSLVSFRAEVGRRGFDHVAEIYADIQKENHDFKLDADAVMSWAYRMMADGHLPEAIHVMNLAIQIDPSSRAYGGLAEAYMKSGQRQEAIESYEKALEKDSGNILAKQRLDELKR
jgi:pimeloyl-ACP methyl ester carboxylesterase